MSTDNKRFMQIIESAIVAGLANVVYDIVDYTYDYVKHDLLKKYFGERKDNENVIDIEPVNKTEHVGVTDGQEKRPVVYRRCPQRTQTIRGATRKNYRARKGNKTS